MAGTHYLVLVGQTSGHTTVADFTVLASSGYRLASADGGVLAYGGAGLFGSAESLHLATPIVGTAATSDGGGYRLVAADGGVFAYGDAAFYGSMSGQSLNGPIVGGGSDVWRERILARRRRRRRLQLRRRPVRRRSGELDDWWRDRRNSLNGGVGRSSLPLQRVDGQGTPARSEPDVTRHRYARKV